MLSQHKSIVWNPCILNSINSWPLIKINTAWAPSWYFRAYYYNHPAILAAFVSSTHVLYDIEFKK